MDASRSLMPFLIKISKHYVRQRRCLHLQEYSSKQILKENGLNVQRFVVVESAKQAKDALKSFRAEEYVVKAQILAGGRGKGHFTSGLKGGVKVTKDVNDVVSYVEKMIGYRLITNQTGVDGALVQKVMIAESANLARETYVAVLLDREAQGPVFIVSPAGGMDIEEVAEKTPHLIFKEPVNISEGLTYKQAAKLATCMRFAGPYFDHACEQLQRLYQMFLQLDAVQVEINPFCETDGGKVLNVDAKLNFDDSAIFRQRRIFAMDDQSELDVRERRAAEHKLNYVALSGNIGCMVNGAGLAMATMDIIKLHGGEPANFLDVGGSVEEQQVRTAFEIITSDEKVKAILVNIFGGIVNCEIIAKGLTDAFKRMSLNVPLIVRLEGTNVEIARQIIAESKLPILTAKNLEDAAKKAVACLN